MIERVNDNQRVQQHGLAEWLQEVQELFQRGYVFDFESNEHYPQSIGHLFTAIMVPAKSNIVVKTQQEETPEVPPELKALQETVESMKAKPGRKPKIES
jgi:hypothetical protein